MINPVSSTSLPAFSRVQKDKERARPANTHRNHFAYGSLGLAGGRHDWPLCTVASANRVRCEIQSVSPALVIASGVALLNLLNSLITTQFLAVGRPELHMRAVTASAVVMTVVCYPACRLLDPAEGQVAAMLAIIVS
jgi:O-antigen/teichoic acid export membrane protein